jgi:hypothetical protein
MTGANHLDEMRGCFDESYLVAEEVHDMLGDLEHANFLKAFELFHKIKLQLPNAMHTCETIDDDKKTVHDWAQIWVQPEHLIKEASKNYVLHRATFKDDVASEKDHWNSEQYFNAGIDLAQVMTDLLPMAHQDVVVQYMMPQDNHIPIVKAFDGSKWFGGVIYGLMGTNHLDDIVNCSHDIYDMSYPKIYEMYEYFVAGDVDKAIMQLFNILSFAPLIFRDCKGMGPDIAAIEEWA